MQAHRGSEPPADKDRGEPGSEAIAFAENAQQTRAHFSAIAFSYAELRELEKLFVRAAGRFPDALYTAAGKIQDALLRLEEQ